MQSALTGGFKIALAAEVMNMVLSSVIDAIYYTKIETGEVSMDIMSQASI